MPIWLSRNVWVKAIVLLIVCFGLKLRRSEGVELVDNDSDCDDHPTLYFLFSEERKFLNAQIWEAYFHSSGGRSSSQCYKHRIFVHDNTPERFIGPKNLGYKLLVNRTSITSCENTLNAM